MAGSKKKKILKLELCNFNVHQVADTTLLWATWVLISYSDWSFHPVYTVFFGCWRCWFSFSAWCSVTLYCWCVSGAALSDYRVEQHYRLSYHSKLSRSVWPMGRTLHQGTKERIKEYYNSITIWSPSLTGDQTQRDTCDASNCPKIQRWRWETDVTEDAERKKMIRIKDM